MDNSPNELVEDLGIVASFQPTNAQRVAKIRIYRWLAERNGIWTVETMPRASLIEAAGARYILKWIKDPHFVAWLAEKDSLDVKLQASREEAFDVLRGIALDETGATSARERIKACEVILNLAGAFPSRTKEVRFIDRDLDSMPDHEVDRQLAEQKRKLGLIEG